MRLVALQLRDTGRFWDEVERRWDRGEAVLPLDPLLPAAATATVLQRMDPSALVDEEGIHHLGGGTLVPDGTAVVLLTSGSTGEPKGVVLVHEALQESIDRTHQALAAPRGARWLCCLPHHHVAGFLTLARSRRLGTDAEIHERFDPELIAAADADFTSLVPTMLARLLDQGVDLSGFSAILLGGAAVPLGLAERAAAAGAQVIRSYGMTETCGGIVYDGAPLPGIEIRITTDELIEVASPTLFSGYRNDPLLTAASLRNGWFTTSDVGRWDGHLLEVFGRVDDMIVTGGEKVAPPSVEERLREHPAVLDAAVLGLPDEEWGSAVVGLVVLQTGFAPPSLDEWRAHVRAKLPAHAAPRRVHVVGSIPRTATGKLDRAALLSLPN